MVEAKVAGAVVVGPRAAGAARVAMWAAAGRVVAKAVARAGVRVAGAGMGAASKVPA